MKSESLDPTLATDRGGQRAYMAKRYHRGVLTLVLSLVLLQSDEVSLEELKTLTQPGSTDERALRSLVDQTLPQVAKVMHANVPRRFSTKIISRTEAARRLRAVLEREYPNHRLARLGAALKAIRLIEPGVDLEREALALYSANVGGFYDPHDKTLYLLVDQPATVQQLVIAHELAHVVQDEKLGLEHLTQEAIRSEDAQLALSAAVEGNAQAVAAQVLTAGLGDEDGTVGSLLTEASALSASIAAESSGAVPWLGLQLSFPYQAGEALMRSIATKEDPAGCSVLSRLPTSTAQVLNPLAYRRNEAPMRGSIGLASLLQGERVYETTLGLANIKLLAKTHGVEPLGDGWRGDVLEVARLGGYETAAWAVAFKETRQAEAFANFYAKLVGRTRQADAVALQERDGTVSAVLVRGNTAVILVRAPKGKWNAVADAASRALH